MYPTCHDTDQALENAISTSPLDEITATIVGTSDAGSREVTFVSQPDAGDEHGINSEPVQFIRWSTLSI